MSTLSLTERPMTDPSPVRPPQPARPPAAAPSTSAPTATAGSETAIPTPPPRRRAGRLDTFRAPKPSAWLIKALAPVNRVLCLEGTPVLRDLVGLRQLPFARGLCDIRTIDLPAADAERLRAVVAPETAAFLTPNHPEFFTDWMLDKEIMARVAPMAACWATHTVVNGLGGAAQAFWLKNNLIAQIPGAGGAAGRAHSIDWALKGHGVLLHPEGQVGWHGDRVGPLFPGAVEMAAEAAGRLAAAGGQRAAFVVPLVWKLKFQRDATPELSAELDYVERRLSLEPVGPRGSLAMRVHALYAGLLARDEAVWLQLRQTGSYGERQRQLQAAMAANLDALLRRFGAEMPAQIAAPFATGDADPAPLLRAGDRWLRMVEPRHAYRDRGRRLIADLRRLMRFRPDLYPKAELTQEQIAECIKRLRNDYCDGTVRDTVNRFVPRPAVPRTAYVRVPEPINVSAILKGRPALTREEIEGLNQDLRARMQSALDGINAMLEQPQAGRPRVWREANPFAAAGFTCPLFQRIGL